MVNSVYYPCMTSTDGTILRVHEGRVEYRRRPGQPFVVVSLPVWTKKGTVRRRFAIEGLTIFDSGLSSITMEVVRQDRRSGSWVFGQNSRRYFTPAASELKDVRIVEVVR